jgi:RecA/RadA recombinase
MTNSILDKILKNSKIKSAAILEDSVFFNNTKPIQTPVPMINVALSGSIDGGLTPGFTMLAGPSRHFKTSFALLMASSYMKEYSDAIMLFYDTEFGSPQSYFESFDIDPSRVVHTPIANIEELKFDLINQLENISRDDNVIIVIDSIGNVASKKELEDAMNEKSVADMTRAKALKSLFRMATPYLKMKNIPLLGINHTYKEIGMFPKDIVSGGTGGVYAADNIWIVGRRQDKDGTEIAGYHFMINVEKSRFVREKSKIPISVSYEGGIMKWSGLLDIALEHGCVKKPKNGWYARWDQEKDEAIGKNLRASETQSKDFWLPILKETNLKEYINKKYSLELNKMIQEEVNDQA